MDSGRVSIRYAKAIYEFALEQGEEVRVYEEMKILTSNYASFRSLVNIMKDPTISKEDKKKVLITAGGVSVSDTFKRALDLVVMNNRETYILFIAMMYLDYFRKKKGIVIGTLTTAQPASGSEQERLRNIIGQSSDKQVDFITHTNPSIVGGFILELDSNLLDASIKSQLNKLKYQLAESSIK